MQAIIISQEIRAKLSQKHDVTEAEVHQCFQNKCGMNLVDDREDHQTDPATLWFISETNTGRLLKIVFVYNEGRIFLKSAFEPNQVEIDLYDKEGK